MANVEVDLRGVPEVQAMLAQFDGQKLQNRTRKALRAGVAVLRKQLRAKASAGRFPRKFKATRTRGHRNPVGVSVNPGSPLSTIFEHGAKPHPIPITKGPFAGTTVQHPGMAARPLVVPVFEAYKDDAERAISDALFEGL